ncbi:MAG: hypothetical protein K5790_10130, partial [Nitrosopumilus sp.]|uniref:hypothetical protein n=1 Tax=Nitrosopumilus sp. TaxID=2024843 RepID=UPI00247E795D
MALEIDEQFLREPLLTTPYDPPNFKKKPWRDLNTPTAFVFVGDKRSGKDVAMDNELEITLNEHFTNVYLFDGGGHEKLYTVINKNCKGKWDIIDSILQIFETEESVELSVDYLERKMESITPKQFEIIIGLMVSAGLLKRSQDVLGITELGLDELDGNLLHCNCHKKYPVTVLKPPYVKHSKEAVDRFNGYYFKDAFEYAKAFMDKLVFQWLPATTDFTKIKKPKEMIQHIKPMLRVVEVTMPRGSRENINKFLEVFTKELIHAREYGNLLVACDPAMYPPDHEGKSDKYAVFATVMDNMKPIADRHFIPLVLDKPRNKWTKREKAYHKIALYAGEIRKPVPNQSMSPEPEASVSKRSFFGFMPESRHAKTFPRVNAQSLGDVLKGVNKQHDIIIVKRSSDRNLGEELKWLSVEMDKAIEEQLIKWKIWKFNKEGKLVKSPISPLVKRKLINDKGLCKISELPDNRAIVVNGNNQWRMTKYNPASWHHKSDRDEFANDTGVKFEFDEKILGRLTETTKKGITKSEKTTKTQKVHNQEMYEKAIEELKKNEMNTEVLYKKMQEIYSDDPIKKELLDKKKPHAFYVGLKRYKDSQKNE